MIKKLVLLCTFFSLKAAEQEPLSSIVLEFKDGQTLRLTREDCDMFDFFRQFEDVFSSEAIHSIPLAILNYGNEIDFFTTDNLALVKIPPKPSFEQLYCMAAIKAVRPRTLTGAASKIYRSIPNCYKSDLPPVTLLDKTLV